MRAMGVGWCAADCGALTGAAQSASASAARLPVRSVRLLVRCRCCVLRVGVDRVYDRASQLLILEREAALAAALLALLLEVNELMPMPLAAAVDAVDAVLPHLPLLLCCQPALAPLLHPRASCGPSLSSPAPPSLRPPLPTSAPWPAARRALCTASCWRRSRGSGWPSAGRAAAAGRSRTAGTRRWPCSW